jgi:hypothetical protein
MVLDPTTSEDCEVCRPAFFRDSGSLKSCSGGTAWNTGTPRNPENLMELILCSFQVLSCWQEQAGSLQAAVKVGFSWGSSSSLLPAKMNEDDVSNNEDDVTPRHHLIRSSSWIMMMID